YIGQPGPRTDSSGRFAYSFVTPGPDYDPSGRIEPALPGPHQICADTGFPGSNQGGAVKACAQFIVEALPTPSPSPQPPPPTPQTINFRAFGLSAVAFAVLIAL